MKGIAVCISVAGALFLCAEGFAKNVVSSGTFTSSGGAVFEYKKYDDGTTSMKQTGRVNNADKRPKADPDPVPKQDPPPNPPTWTGPSGTDYAVSYPAPGSWLLESAGGNPLINFQLRQPIQPIFRKR